MNIDRNSSTNNYSCGLDMTMEGLILHDQLPCDLFNPSYPLQTHHIIPSSSPLLSTGFPSDHQLGSQKREEQQQEEPEEELGAMKEMMYKIAAMQPVDIDPATIQKPKRRNVHISNNPQSVAARRRRERVSEKIRILRRLVPGGSKMDTAAMLDEAIRYVKFLKKRVHELHTIQSMPPRHIGRVMGQFSAIDCPVILSSSVQSAAEADGFTIGGTGHISCAPCALTIVHEVIRIIDLSD